MHQVNIKNSKALATPAWLRHKSSSSLLSGQLCSHKQTPVQKDVATIAALALLRSNHTTFRSYYATYNFFIIKMSDWVLAHTLPWQQISIKVNGNSLL